MFPLWHFLYAKYNSYKSIIRFKQRRLGVPRYSICHSSFFGISVRLWCDTPI